MAAAKKRALKNKTFRIGRDLELRLAKRAAAAGTSVNQIVVHLLERALPRASPFGRVRALGDRVAHARPHRAGPAPRFTKDELHGRDE